MRATSERRRTSEDLLQAVARASASHIAARRDKEHSMSKTVVASENAPKAVGPYSAGIDCGEVVYLSGQLGLDPATGKLAEGVEAQAKQSLANVGALLEAAGLGYENVVKTTVLLADINDFATVNAVYGDVFPEPYPARSCFAVAALPMGGLVEIEVIAVR